MLDLTHYNPQNKYIVFICSNLDGSPGGGFGGFGDRMLGLVSSFVLALLLQFKFVIYWRYPTELTELFDEKHPKVKWNGITSINITNVLNFLDENIFTNKDILLSPNIIENITNNTGVISNKSFYLFLLKNPILQDKIKQYNIHTENIFHDVFHLIFGLKNEFRLQYNSVLNKIIQSKTACIQVRSYLGEFEDTFDQTKLAPFIQFLKDNENEYEQLYICSDNQENIDYIQELFPHKKNIKLDHDIIHLEKTKDNNKKENLYRMLLEICTVGKCDKVLISNWSNFGRFACLIQKKNPYIVDKNIYKQTNLNSIISKDTYF